ncbi:MAG: MATE family efflux transporter [Thermoguttaceae bacterium]
MNHVETTLRLEERPVGRLLWEYSIPAVTAMILNASYQIVDRHFIGQTHGDIGIAAITLSLPLATIMMAAGMTVGIGSNTLIAIRLGEKRYDEAERIVGQSLFLFLMLSLFFIIAGLPLLNQLLRLFGTSERVLPFAKEYATILVCGCFFHQLSFGVNSFLRSEGKPRLAMVTIIIAAILNIIFDWLFLYVFKTGIWGAAVATILAQIVSSIWVIWHYISGKTLLRWRLKYIIWDRQLSRQVFLLGLPPLIMQSLSCLVQIIQMNLLMYYGNLYGQNEGIENGGDLAVWMIGVLFVISMGVFFPLLGLNQGVQPIVGYNIGARKFRRVADVLKLAIYCELIFTIFCATILFCLPELLLRQYLQSDSPASPAMIALGSYVIRIFVLMLPAAGFAVLAAGYFQANGMPKKAIALTLVRQIFILIPAMLIMPSLFHQINGFSGLDGVWFAIPVSDCGAFLISVFFLRQEFRRLAEQERAKESADLIKKGETIP